MARPPTPAQTVASILAAQFRPLDYAQARTSAQAAKEQAALQNATRALVQQLQGGAAQAAPLYDAAVNQTTGLAQQAAQMLGAANPNPQIQSDLSAINAPEAQHAQLAQQTQAQFPGQGAVLNIMQGSIPGASLVAQKAAEQGFLAGLPTVAALEGEQSLKSLLARAADSRDKYVEQRLGVAGQAASLLPQLQQQVVENRQADRSFGLQQRQLRLQIASEAADERYNQAKLRADEAAARAQATGDAQDRADANYWKGVAAQQNQQRIAIERQRARASGPDPKTGLTPYQKAEIGLSQQRIDLSKRSKSQPSQRYKPLSPKELQEQADLAYYGREPVTNKDGQVTKPGVAAIGYQTALAGMMESGVKLNVAQRYLNQFYAPGERGRPLVSFQQRQKGVKPPKPKRKTKYGLRGPVGG